MSDIRKAFTAMVGENDQAKASLEEGLNCIIADANRLGLLRAMERSLFALPSTTPTDIYIRTLAFVKWNELLVEHRSELERHGLA